jgi:hypothetical protein
MSNPDEGFIIVSTRTAVIAFVSPLRYVLFYAQQFALTARSAIYAFLVLSF